MAMSSLFQSFFLLLVLFFLCSCFNAAACDCFSQALCSKGIFNSRMKLDCPFAIFLCFYCCLIPVGSNEHEPFGLQFLLKIIFGHLKHRFLLLTTCD